MSYSTPKKISDHNPRSAPHVLVPLELGDNHPAACELVLELSRESHIECPSCSGEGGPCDQCDGQGKVTDFEQVSWKEVQETWRKMVPYVALSPEPGADAKLAAALQLLQDIHATGALTPTPNSGPTHQDICRRAAILLPDTPEDNVDHDAEEENSPGPG